MTTRARRMLLCASGGYQCHTLPGFVLAQLCAQRFPAEAHDGTIGMVLLNHGLFTFADDARTAYETMLKSCNACHDQFHKGKPQLAP